MSCQRIRSLARQDRAGRLPQAPAYSANPVVAVNCEEQDVSVRQPADMDLGAPTYGRHMTQNLEDPVESQEQVPGSGGHGGVIYDEYESSRFQIQQGKQSICGQISCRHVLAALNFLGFFFAFNVRVTFNIALVAMVNFTGQSNQINLSDECPAGSANSSNPLHDNMGDFNWDSKMQSLLMGSFYYGYIITQLPGGYLSERFSSKLIFGGAVFTSGVVSLLSPVLARWDPRALIAARFVMGLCQGPIYPSNQVIWSQWAPPLERSTLIAFTCSAGAMMGYVVSMILTGILCTVPFLGGWPLAFYLFGVLSTVWSVVWLFVIYENPADHPRISSEELHLLSSTCVRKADRPPTPWKALITSRPIWSLVIYGFCDGLSFYVVFTEIPMYMKQILHYDIAQDGILMSVPYMASFLVSIVIGPLADAVLRKGWMSTTAVRKCAVAIGEGACMVALIGIGYTECNHVAAVALLVTGLGIGGFNVAGINVNALDFAPQFAGSIVGITNTVSNLGGFLSPIIVASITNGMPSRSKWQIVFFLTGGTFGLGMLAFLLLGSGELQSWAAGSPSKREPLLEEEDDEAVVYGSNEEASHFGSINS